MHAPSPSQATHPGITHSTVTFSAKVKTVLAWMMTTCSSLVRLYRQKKHCWVGFQTGAGLQWR